jgi:hypothetical protein
VSAPDDGEVAAWFTPVWAGGWTLTRALFALAAAATFLPRVFAIRDVYAASDMVFAGGVYRLAEIVRFTPGTATAIWVAGASGIALVAFGGRALRPGIALFLLADWAFLATEALNVKAYDRLLTWIAVGLLVSPAGERGLRHKWRSPAARFYLLAVFASIYGSTGLTKLLYEPAWWTGEVLSCHLIHPTFAGGALATFVSGQPWLVAPMGWWTLFFEVGFLFLVWFRRTNPWLLVSGVLFHLGLEVLMDVGTFGLVSVCAYPALLHPEVARELWERRLHRPGTSPRLQN